MRVRVLSFPFFLCCFVVSWFLVFGFGVDVTSYGEEMCMFGPLFEVSDDAYFICLVWRRESGFGVYNSSLVLCRRNTQIR